MRKSILIFIFALLGIFSAHAYDFKVDGICYNLISGTADQVAVTSDSGNYSGSVVIPSSVIYNDNTYRVTSIGFGAFLGCSGLTSVTIPESVTFTGGHVFDGCSGLTSVEWNAVDCKIVGIERLFKDCEKNITDITFGSQVERIPDDLCYGMNKLTSVTIPSGVISIGSCAFTGCSGLTTMAFPESVDTVGTNAFYGTSISNLLYNSKIFAYMPTDYSGEYEIPSGIQTIAGGAFRNCRGLTSVTIPESVATVGYGAFSGCSGLTSVEWNAVVYQDFWLVPEGALFYGCENITNVTFGNQVTHIPAYLCCWCSGLTSVTFPESLTSIGEAAFAGCTGLTSVTLPESVDTIGWGAFYNCSGLTSVISLAKNPPYCEQNNDAGDGVFSDYSAMLFVPRGCKADYQSAEEWSKFTTIYESGFDGTGLITVQPNDTSMGRVTGGGEYEIDEEIRIEAIPNEGYHFVKWDDENTDNPRTLKVIADITLTAIFEKNPDTPTANENAETDNFRVYVQNRTIYLSEDRGVVQVYNMAGQCVYNGHATAIPVQLGGVYVLVAGTQRVKVLVK